MSGSVRDFFGVVLDAGRDGLFPKPFARTDRKATAWFGVLAAAVLPSLLMLWSHTTKTGLTVFTYLVDLTVVTVAIPYFISALAQLAYLVSGRRQVQGWQLARDLSIAGALFATWVTFAAGYTAIYQALLAIFIGLAIYPFLKARRERLGQIPAPADLAVAAAGDGAASGAPTRHRHLRLHCGTVAPTGTGASENPQGQS